MAKTPQQIVEEARKKNAAQAAKAEPDTSALDELMGGIEGTAAPVAPEPAPVAPEPAPEPAIPVTGITTVEDAVFVPPTAVQDYAADAELTPPPANLTPPEVDQAPEAPVRSWEWGREEEEPIGELPASTKAEMEAGRKALGRFK